ncbi:MAG: hypothetical protein NTX45_12490 [Proteobacteria bacterium]|nr:hypothetical protein [Pseudomonadota bacterium]
MIIHPRPDQEFKIHEAMRSGLIQNETELLDLGLENLQQRLLAKARQSTEKPTNKKSLVELFAPLRGLDLDFERNPSTSRPVEL